MEEKPIKLEMSKMLGSVLSRLLVHEIDQQEEWIEEENEKFCKDIKRSEVRRKIIGECEELIEQLEKQDIPKYFQCYR